MSRTVLIVQARMGSTRLPGKVLKEIPPGRTMLNLTIERLKRCRRVAQIVIAVPEGRLNDPVAEEAQEAGAAVFRGSEEDVLGRYLGAAKLFAAELVVRVTSDCPLSDPSLVDLHIERMQQCIHQVDFVTNMTRPSFPLGLAVEVMPIDTLQRMDRLSTTPYLREHVTTMAFERPELFATETVSDDRDRSRMRWTVDYPEDLNFVRAVYGALYPRNRNFDKQDVLAFLEQHPEVAALNAYVGP